MKDTDSGIQALSWRDPSGCVFNDGGRILRAVAPAHVEQCRDLLSSSWMAQLIADGLLPRTWEIDVPAQFSESKGQWLWLEHQALGFPCYPHEITALQLFDSGVLTLRIAIVAALNGWMLKDASAWNVLFSTGRPVFVDILSFERRDASEAWPAYGQFVRHFLLPLMLYRRQGVTPAEIFIAHRDGVSPEKAFQMLHGLHLLSASALEFVVMPRWLERAGSRLIESRSRVITRKSDSPIGRDLLLQTLRRLERSLENLRPDRFHTQSVWRAYEEERAHYTGADIAAKTAFVRQSLNGTRSVLDLGCNAGEFSLLALESASTVVAADADHPALSRLYARIRGANTAVTPVFLNIGRPTPAVGWSNLEVPAFLDRASGNFDCILVLGLVHHLLVSERAGVEMLRDLLARLRPERVILEWVDPGDQKFRQLAGLNGPLYEHLSTEVFDKCMAEKFGLSDKLTLPCGTRVMYLWNQKS